ncbi:site-specific integrase [Cryptosporangium arvum]|uniref:site-specific integrase n=1 Tax=Cryptosporangium arvum TaxID=80871 RepID=UPI0004BBE330|nr:site-specific integrase [Cryptosporangium arvum]
MTRQIDKHGPTKGAATNALLEAVRDRGRRSGINEINRLTLMQVVIDAWWDKIEAGTLSPGTKEAYRYRLDGQVIPALGKLRVHEVTVSVVYRHLRKVLEKHGPAIAKMTRTVLSGVLTLAVQHDALDRNPVREMGPLTDRKPRRKARALTVDEARKLRASLAANKKAVDRDLPDFVDMMLATGLRISECSAIVWDALDLDAATVEVRGTVIRIKGVGLAIKPEPKSEAGYRTLVLPRWAVEMLRRRHSAAGGSPRGDDPVFPAPLGGLRDRSNTSADLADAFEDAGMGWVTSHVFRKTVATLMDRAGLTARAAADQLGHAKPSMTQDVYMGRDVADTGAAVVLEQLAG